MTAQPAGAETLDLDRRRLADGLAGPAAASGEARLDRGIADTARATLALYIAVGCLAGAVIALQITIMRLFSVGSWAHFGSFVVSLAMLGFGLTSAVMCVAKDWFERRWRFAAGAALFLFGPLAVIAVLGAQLIPFNAIFIISDPTQKWRLAANFALYLLPFLAGAVFLGVVFLKSTRTFGRVYFADLAGSGLCGLVVLAAMYVLAPDRLAIVPIALWAAGGLAWLVGRGSARGLVGFVCVALAAALVFLLAPEQLRLPRLAVSDYKGVSYARKFPDSHLVYRRASPFGLVEIYGSSYLHFAPGLSDNAAFNVPDMPADAYLGMYIDSEGPSGIIRDLPDAQTVYFKYLPMFYPYVLKQNPDTFVVQLGGGISSAVALRSGASRVTVAEGNPAVLEALRSKPISDFTGGLLFNPKVRVIDHEGRHFLAETGETFDVIDLSLADSAGLSNPGGYAIVEKYNYSRESFETYMRALNPGGVLSVTLWNKEEPPKSVLRLYATMAAAAKALDPDHFGDDFFVASAYLSTTTVLYKRGGFSTAEIAKLRDHTRAMSFDAVYWPGVPFDAARTDGVLDGYQTQIFATGDASQPDAPDPTAPADEASGGTGADGSPSVLPSTQLGRIAWHGLVTDSYADVAKRYIFDTRVLTNDQPYFAAYLKLADLPRITDRLELFQDEWGYLSLWATLAVACAGALLLILLPLIWGWRAIFSHNPGKGRTLLYFACLGLGYIMVEVGLIANFVLALGNATVSASILITGMLVFSGLGSLVSERILPRARIALPLIFLAIGAILVGYGVGLAPVLERLGSLPYGPRLLACFALIAPPAFLMGFPMPTAMTSLGRLGKEHMFIWAWGVNGCFSVIGAAVVPLVATAFGIGAVIEIAGLAYLVAIPAFFGVLLPRRALVA